eukprot:Skav217643  [mRNA]  locus=scaffold4288:1615:10578:+ [translate_table: standard]
MIDEQMNSGLPVDFQHSPTHRLDHKSDLQREVMALWRQGNRLRNEGRNKRHQLKRLSEQTVSKQKMEAVAARRRLLESQHKSLEKRQRLRGRDVFQPVGGHDIPRVFSAW